MKGSGITLGLMTAFVPPATTAGRDTVLLLHGLSLGGWAMYRVERALEREGYRVVNLSYPSRTMPLEELANHWLPERLAREGVPLDPETAASARLHVVTHSMGGIVLRLWMRDQGVPPTLRRVVMLAPPNQGTPLVERIGHWRAFRVITGVNGARLGAGEESLPRQLGPWPAGPELGVIAGDRPVIPFLLARFAGRPGDGKVPVASTRLDGMRDHLVLPHSHTWITYRRKPIAQAVAFLRDGHFSR